MTHISKLLAEGRTVSFEFFPPKDREARMQLEHTLWELEKLSPSFVSVTYGAGGSTREFTHDIVLHILQDTPLNPMAHLTCAGHTRAELTEIVSDYGTNNVQNILALGGDVPKDGELVDPELQYASELIELVRELGDFSVGVAAHPEIHPRSPDRASDRKRTAEKLSNADFAITQFFFETEKYLSLVNDLADLGCTKPIIPGIMPVTNVNQVERFAQLSGATFPIDLAERLRAANDPAHVRVIGIEVATQLCRELLDEGAPGLHFYTLNRSTATREIVANLNLI